MRSAASSCNPFCQERSNVTDAFLRAAVPMRFVTLRSLQFLAIEIELSLHSGAHFADLIFQKCAEVVSFSNILKCKSSACYSPEHFFNDISSTTWVIANFSLLIQLRGGQTSEPISSLIVFCTGLLDNFGGNHVWGIRTTWRSVAWSNFTSKYPKTGDHGTLRWCAVGCLSLGWSKRIQAFWSSPRKLVATSKSVMDGSQLTKLMRLKQDLKLSTSGVKKSAFHVFVYTIIESYAIWYWYWYILILSYAATNSKSLNHIISHGLPLYSIVSPIGYTFPAVVKYEWMCHLKRCQIPNRKWVLYNPYTTGDMPLNARRQYIINLF